MIRTKELKKLFERGITEAHEAKQNGRDMNAHQELRLARQNGVKHIRTLLGVKESSNGKRYIEKAAAKPEDFSLRELANALLGHEWVEENWNPNSRRSEQLDAMGVLEAGPGLDPTVFANISAFNAAATGLLEAKVIEKFNDPMMIADKLFETVPTKLNGEKMIGTTGISGAGGVKRKPSQPHARVGFNEKYITTPELEESGLGIDITIESAFYDLTGQVLQRAGEVGELLIYGKERECLSVFIGAVNPFVYNGTGYNTYQTTTPWINDQTNHFEDLSDLENSKSLFRRRTDPDTGREILVEGMDIVCAPDREITFDRVLNATEVRQTTNTSLITISGNPIKGKYNVMSSQILFNLLKAAAVDGGLALSDADALEYWFHGDFKKCFKYMEAWALRVDRLGMEQYVNRDRGIIQTVIADYRGIPVVKSPWHVNRNK